MEVHSANSNIPNVDPSSKMKVSTERKRNPKGVSPPPSIDRSSPYLRSTVRRGSKAKQGALVASEDSRTHKVSLGECIITPHTIEHTRPTGELKMACTFVDSVINLCSKSKDSCTEIREPVPSEDMFLFLIRECGVREAVHWASVMNIPHKRSLELLNRLWYGEKGRGVS